MRSPNEEQKVAIEHNGGVLLNAGAGSGKTYVLVEHVHYLVSAFVENNKELTDLEFSKKLKSYLNKIVLMTFTNDAAGEIRNRVLMRFENFPSRPDVIKNSLGALTITTIHGFCMKLIRQGLIKAPTNMRLVDENQIKRKIEALALEWFEQNDIDEEIIIKNASHIIHSMFSIFTSPELRDEWTKKSIENTFDEKKYFKEVFELLDMKNFWSLKYDLTSVDEFHDKPWFLLLSGLNDIKESDPSIDNLEKISDLFASVGRLVVSKKIDPIYKEYVDEAKKLKDFSKKNLEDLLIYKNENSAFLKWQNYLLELFKYIEKQYYFSEECSFSDLEYLVYKDLHHEEVVEAISSQYDYFIVDEYQDTSWIQFDILKKISKNDFAKIFCVGDRKQAIYGFRGGELGVFNETEANIPQNLYLSNNYRSEEHVINYNNKFFEFIFSLGKGFEGDDSFSVPVDYQTFPDSKDSGLGEIKNILINLEDEEVPKRLSATHYSMYEALAMVSQIKEWNNEETCVLYKNLKPSKDLIAVLISEKIPFQAQVKIPYSDDPILVIFKAIIDYLIKVKENRSDEQKLYDYFNFYLQGVLTHFELKLSLENRSLDHFVKDCDQLGIYYSFVKFLYSKGVANSSYQNNLKRIEDICDTCLDNLSEIWVYLKGIESKSYSTRFSYLNNPKVFIMTAHASKGLQFKNVILGGVHNNGRKLPISEVVGKLPSSFRWTPNHSRKKLYKSPNYIYEQLLNDHKDFSESKRLLYVACTRAVERIMWVDISAHGKAQADGKDSWIQALRLYRENVTSQRLEDTIDQGQYKKSNAPLYFIDNLGIKTQKTKIDLGLVSELSVTKLSLIALCSKKFYFSQILKLDDDLEGFYKDHEIKYNKRVGVSDADRGSRIHYEIESYIKGSNVQVSDLQSFEFVKDLIDQEKQAQNILVSEKEIKFSFFGQMVTGIPDLFILENNKVTKIWDFKTGTCDEDDKRQYFYQLLTYAYGLHSLKYEMNDSVELALVLIDQKEVVSTHIKVPEIKEKLYQYWVTLSDLTTRELSHCQSCLYGNLCHPTPSN